MTDSRQAQRAPITTTIRLKSASNADFLEHRAHDVSEGGMFVETAEPMKVGTLLRMEMTFPNENEPVNAVARVVWTREAAEATTDLPAGMGVKFVKVDTAAKGAIQTIVEENKGAASDRGPAARGSLAGGAPAPAEPAPAPVAKVEPKPEPEPEAQDEENEEEEDEEDEEEENEAPEPAAAKPAPAPEPASEAKATPAPARAPEPAPKKATPEPAAKDEPAKAKKKSKKERRAEGRKKSHERKRAEREAAAQLAERERTSRADRPREAREMPLAAEPGRGDAATRPLLIILIVLAIVAGIYFFTRTTDRPAPDQDSPAHEEHAEGDREGETDTAE